MSKFDLSGAKINTGTLSVNDGAILMGELVITSNGRRFSVAQFVADKSGEPTEVTVNGKRYSLNEIKS